MCATQREGCAGDAERAAGRLDADLPVAREAALQLRPVGVGEGVAGGFGVMLGHLAAQDGVVGPIDEGVRPSLVLQDAQLGVHITLHLAAVTVQVVGRDVHQHGDVGLEAVHVIELETAQLDHVARVRLLGHLQGEAAPDVARQANVHTGLAQDVVRQRRGRRLAIAARDADHLRVGVSSGQLDLGEDRDATLHGRAHDGRRVGYARALDDLVGVEDLGLRVMALFKGNTTLEQHRLVFLGDRAAVGDEHVEALRPGQHRGSHATLARAQDDDSACVACREAILRPVWFAARRAEANRRLFIKAQIMH